MQSTSPFGKLNWVDIWKGLRGSLVVFAAAFLIGGWENLQMALEAQDFGYLDFAKPLIISGGSFVFEELRRLLKNYSQ